MTGAKDIRQLVFGPRITLSPYHIGVPGMYICSAATPPGPGAHGMCGANAGQAALRDLGDSRAYLITSVATRAKFTLPRRSHVDVGRAELLG